MVDKLKIVVSDLHLSAGALERGNKLENFTADVEFAGLLREIQQESDWTNKEVELILNGDCLEFLQVPAVDRFIPENSYPIEVYRDSSAEASVKRLKIILEGHQQVFAALTDFMHVEGRIGGANGRLQERPAIIQITEIKKGASPRPPGEEQAETD